MVWDWKHYFALITFKYWISLAVSAYWQVYRFLALHEFQTRHFPYPWTFIRYNRYPIYNIIFLFFVQIASGVNVFTYQMVIFISIVGLIVLFVICYLGTRISLKVGSVGDSAYTNLNWYDFSTNVQMKILLLIMRSQKAFFFFGGMLPHTLQHFLRVILFNIFLWLEEK